MTSLFSRKRTSGLGLRGEGVVTLNEASVERPLVELHVTCSRAWLVGAHSVYTRQTD